MTPAEVFALLEQTFGPAITAKNPTAMDPFAAVDPARLVEVCTFLRDDPRLRFEMLNDVSGVDANRIGRTGGSEIWIRGEAQPG